MAIGTAGFDASGAVCRRRRRRAEVNPRPRQHKAPPLSWQGFAVDRDGGIRTRDPLNPIQVRYRAALRPVSAPAGTLPALARPPDCGAHKLPPGRGDW